MYEDTTTRVLNKMVQQPMDGAFNITWDSGATYTERWKGPYSEMQGIAQTGGTILGRKLVVGQKRVAPPSGNWVSAVTPANVPVPAKGMAWMLDSINVTEIEAGEHGILELVYKAVPENLLPMGGYGTESTSADASAGIEVYTEQCGWNLRWGTYSRNVLEYCTKEPNVFTQGDDPDMVDEQCARADKVIRCAQLPKPRESQIPAELHGIDKQYMWVEPNQAGESVSAEVKALTNDREIKIYNWYARGMQPVFHYPIITFTHAREYPLSAQDVWSGLPAGSVTVGMDDVDYAIPDPRQDADMKDCPFTLGDWKWIDCGTECQTKVVDSITKGSIQIQWTTTWEGCKEYEHEWYGEDGERWIPGAYADNSPVTDGGGGEGGEGGEGGGGEG